MPVAARHKSPAMARPRNLRSTMASKIFYKFAYVYSYNDNDEGMDQTATLQRDIDERDGGGWRRMSKRGGRRGVVIFNLSNMTCRRDGQKKKEMCSRGMPSPHAWDEYGAAKASLYVSPSNAKVYYQDQPVPLPLPARAWQPYGVARHAEDLVIERDAGTSRRRCRALERGVVRSSDLVGEDSG